MITRITFILSCLLLFSSCSNRTNLSPFPSISEKTKADLERPINCRTASRDLRVLEEERASVGRQVLAGVRSVFPIAAVAGILMGDYSDRVQVATGQYNSDLETKIAQIKATCNVN